MNGIQEVSGSIPLISTIKTEVSFETSVFLFPAVFKTKRAQEAFLIPAVVLPAGGEHVLRQIALNSSNAAHTIARGRGAALPPRALKARRVEPPFERRNPK